MRFSEIIEEIIDFSLNSTWSSSAVVDEFRRMWRLRGKDLDEQVPEYQVINYSNPH